MAFSSKIENNPDLNREDLAPEGQGLLIKWEIIKNNLLEKIRGGLKSLLSTKEMPEENDLPPESSQADLKDLAEDLLDPERLRRIQEICLEAFVELSDLESNAQENLKALAIDLGIDSLGTTDILIYIEKRLEAEGLLQGKILDEKLEELMLTDVSISIGELALRIFETLKGEKSNLAIFPR